MKKRVSTLELVMRAREKKLNAERLDELNGMYPGMSFYSLSLGYLKAPISVAGAKFFDWLMEKLPILDGEEQEWETAWKKGKYFVAEAEKAWFVVIPTGKRDFVLVRVPKSDYVLETDDEIEDIFRLVV